MSRTGKPLVREIVLTAMVAARRSLEVSEIAKLVGKSPEAAQRIIYSLQTIGVVEADADARQGRPSRAFLGQGRKWKPTGKPLPAPAPKTGRRARVDSPTQFDHHALAAALGMNVAPAQVRDAHIHMLTGIH